jgi:hypothetical protein
MTVYCIQFKRIWFQLVNLFIILQRYEVLEKLFAFRNYLNLNTWQTLYFDLFCQDIYRVEA